jgi:TetR/AcrR family transcriptional regulator, lmrAB and yxaGH operons repressor
MSTPIPQPEATGTRDRLITAMQSQLRRSGFHGTGLSELLHSADAPKGVLYHHFPAGKSELAAVAIESAASAIVSQLQGAIQTNQLLDFLERWVQRSVARSAANNFSEGCPIAGATMDSSQDERLQAAVKAAFGRLQEALADGFAAFTPSPARASTLASLVLTTYQGAMLMLRAHREPELVEDSTRVVLDLVRSEMQTRRRKKCSSSEAGSTEQALKQRSGSTKQEHAQAHHSITRASQQRQDNHARY